MSFDVVVVRADHADTTFLIMSIELSNTILDSDVRLDTPPTHPPLLLLDPSLRVLRLFVYLERVGTISK